VAHAVQARSAVDMLSERIRSLMRERGWERLTEVQEKAVPAVLRGDNVIIVAPTGYGKTEAALLPILSMMSEEDIEPVALLYITPLRALINDIYERISWWAERLGLIVARKHGDVPQSERARRLRRVPHILVTSPESLEIDLDWASRFREHYANLRWVIVDEVHEVVSTKRGVQLALLLERLRRIAGDFQLILLSATIGDPELAAQAFTGSSKRRLSLVSVASRKEVELSVDYVQSGRTGFWREAAERLLRHMEPLTIVFVNSKFVAESLHREIEKMGVEGVVVHHASIAPEERQHIEAAAKEGKLKMIIATKTLELGIDIGYARKVILFRPTGQVSSLLQRLGRSGHRLGETIRGVIIATDEVELIEALAEARLAVKGAVEPPSLPEKPLDMAARLLLGLALSGGHTVEEAYDILRSVYYFRGMSREEFDQLVEYLVQRRMIKVDGEGRLGAGAQFYRIWRFNPGESAYSWWVRSFSEFFTTMGEKKNYIVKTSDGRVIGELDPDFVIQVLRAGQVIRLAGRSWQVLTIDEHSNKVIVAEAEGDTAWVPFWRGRGPEASKLVVEEVERVVQELHETLNVTLPDNVKLTEEAGEQLRKMAEEVKTYRYIAPSSRRVIVEDTGNETIYVHLADVKALRTLAYTAMLLAYRSDTRVYTKSTYYGFALPSLHGFDALKELLSLDRNEFQRLAIEAAEKSPYFVETARSIQLVFGVTHRLRRSDGLAYREALRQTLQNYFDLNHAWDILERIREGSIRVVPSTTRVSFYARDISKTPPEKLWLGNVEDLIAEALEGMAFTVEELADALNLPENLIEQRLRSMLKPNSIHRVFYFYDVDTGEVRWALVKDAEAIAGSEEFSSSFNPPNSDALYLLLAKSENGSLVHVIVRVEDAVKRPEELLKQIPFKELSDLKVVPLTGYFEGEPPRYQHVPRELVPILVRNAATVIQMMQMNNPVI